MKGDKIFDASMTGEITTKSNANYHDWDNTLESGFSNLNPFPSCSRKIAIEAKFFVSSNRLRENGALDLDNLIKPVLDVMTKTHVIDDDASIFDLKISKFPTDGKQILQISGWEWL
tara:strand:+ start:1112 stop:1459 length:348 start_codon:yes stop_codon:yes gene_type:complete